jgi:hypothetical protein
MNLHPINDVLIKAQRVLNDGGSFHQQFLCSNCGVKQTMAEPNRMFSEGICEACGAVTDIMKNGCNLLAIFGPGGNRGAE